MMVKGFGSSFSKIDPRRVFDLKNGFSYEKLPGSDYASATFRSGNFSKFRWRSPGRGPGRLPFPRLSPLRSILLFIISVLFGSMIWGTVGIRHRHRGQQNNAPEAHQWESYTRLFGFYNGVRMLVPPNEHIAEQDFIAGNKETLPSQDVSGNSWVSHLGSHSKAKMNLPEEPPIDPVAFNPYPNYDSEEWLKDNRPVKACYLDEEDTVLPPNIAVYPGLPQNMSDNFFGSYEVLGLRSDICYERFGRLGPYGYGYSEDDGGFPAPANDEMSGLEKIWNVTGRIDWRDMDWGAAQKRCYEKNKARFENILTETNNTSTSKKRVPRHAYILRTWTGYSYTEKQLLAMRAMISELSLKSGGEYEVHLLVHVKDDSLAIWASDQVYHDTLTQFVPKEFWGIATLWSESQMRLNYPGPFPDNVFNHAKQDIHGVYRSAHFPLQWFAHTHPDYDYYWNWEMDVRYVGHYYEFHDRIGKWAEQQPRKGIWERSARYYIPRLHGNWSDFVEMVEEETFKNPGDPVWGPVEFPNKGMLPHPDGTAPPRRYLQDKYQWGVGEPADLITFNPIFDAGASNWVFRDDVSGYSLDLAEPPRRTAIITMSRLSKRLLQKMHEETWRMHHHMFPEMWPPSCALHHGMKAVYTPHPIYFDRKWPLDVLDKTFNRPERPEDSPFGGGEHNQAGNSFYYNSGFSGTLWRRWLGSKENSEGGYAEEVKGSGRLCLRSQLFHPIKYETITTK